MLALHFRGITVG